MHIKWTLNVNTNVLWGGVGAVWGRGGRREWVISFSNLEVSVLLKDVKRQILVSREY